MNSDIKPYETAWEAVRDFENGVPQLWRDQEGGVDWERREAGWETGDMVRYYPEFAPAPAGWGDEEFEKVLAAVRDPDGPHVNIHSGGLQSSCDCGRSREDIYDLYQRKLLVVTPPQPEEPAEPKEVRCKVELDEYGQYTFSLPETMNCANGLNSCWDFPKCLGVEIRDGDGNEFVIRTPYALWDAININGDVPMAVLMAA